MLIWNSIKTHSACALLIYLVLFGIVLPISHSVCVFLSSCVAERAGSEWIPEASHWDCLFRSTRISEHSSHFKGRDECLSLQKSAASMRGNISTPASAACFGDNYIITHYTIHRLLLKTGPLLLKLLAVASVPNLISLLWSRYFACLFIYLCRWPCKLMLFEYQRYLYSFD